MLEGIGNFMPTALVFQTIELFAIAALWQITEQMQSLFTNKGVSI